MTNINFIPFEYNNGRANMLIDEKILDEAITHQNKTPCFRLYGWTPACISLGRNQKTNFLNEKLLTDLNIDTVTRLTGGRALLHDKEITYSFICNQDFLKNGASVTASYKEISEILINAFQNLGITLSIGGEAVQTKHDYCMLVSTGADLNYNGKKLIGSAQCRKKGYILQHGSILYDYDKELLEKVFNEPVETNKITTIKEIMGITQDQFLKTFTLALHAVLEKSYRA